MTEKSDSYLVRQSQEGDARSFELLVVKYQKRVFNVIFRIVHNRDVVEDLAQDTFINAFKSIKSFKGNSSFYTWLYRIAANVSLNYLSKQKKALFVDDDSALESEAVTTREAKAGTSPENNLGNKELGEAISGAVMKLPEDIRVSVVLREYDGLSYEEIAEVMDCPIGTVRSRIFRGRAILQDSLKSYI